MRIRPYRAKCPGKGIRRPQAPRSRARMITVTFTETQARVLAARAREEHTSFSEQVRTVVEWGLESAGIGDD